MTNSHQTPLDVELAKLDPARVFKTPHDITKNVELTDKQKIDILYRWAYDLLEDAVADEENMMAFESDSQLLLDSIIIALRELGIQFILKEGTPTKHGA